MKTALWRFFCSLLLLALFACAKEGLNADAQAAYLGEPGTAKTRDALYLHLQEFDSIGIAGNRKESHYPGAALPHLHGWLAEGRGLKRTRVDGREVLLLKPMPAQVYSALSTLAFQDGFRSGFEILQASFWKQVRDAQKQGLTVGFLEPDANFNVSGVYYREYNYGQGLLLIDVFAGQGTMTHEYRHHVQYQAFRKKEKARYWWQKPREIGSSCLSMASSFFGELDATTTELPQWVGVFRTLDITPEWHQRAKKGDLDNTRFSQSYILITNLDYPGNATQRMEGQNCPEELMRAVAGIKASTDNFSTNVTEEFTNKLFGLRMEHFHAWAYVNSKCGGTQPLPAEVASVCEKKKQRIAAVPAEAETLKAGLDAALSAEAKDRPLRIRRAFDAMPLGLRKDLCEFASSFEFLADCKAAQEEDFE